MADESGELEIIVELDNAKFKTQLKDVENQTKKSGGKISSTLKRDVGKPLGRVFGGLKGQLAGLAASIAAAFATRQTIAAASRQEEAINTLNSALASTGEFSQAASRDVQEFAAQLQATTTIGDELAIEMFALAQAFTQNKDAAKELTAAAADFAAGAGINFEEAVRRLGRATQGTTDDIAKFAPEIKNLTRAQLEAGDATRILAERFSGFAANQIKTFSGAMKQAVNTFGDLLEKMGETIIKSPQVIKAIQAMSQFFVTLSGSIGEAGSSGTALIKILSIIIKSAGFVTAVFDGLGDVIARFAVGVQANLIGLKRMVALLTGNKEEAAALKFQIESLAEVLNTSQVESSNMSDALAELAGSLDVIAMTSNEVVEPALDNVNKKIVEQKGLTEGLTQAWQEFGDQFRSINKDGEEDFKNYNKVVTAESKKLIGGGMRTLSKGFQQGFSNIGTALIKGGNVFAAFGKAVLSMFAGLAQQLGQFYLALGIANVFLNPAAAAQFFLASALFFVLSGVLGALAGGGGGGGGSATADSGGGAEASPLFDTPETVEGEPGTAITVNIEGNVLDRRETGLEIADALKESFDLDGTTIEATVS